METVLLVIHLMIVTAMVGLVLVQRSEGGALGIGGGGNFMASRGSGNVLTRTTTYLALGFFITSIALTLLARANQDPDTILDGLLADPVTEGAERPATGNLLDLIRPATTVPTDDAGAVTPVPAAETPAVPNEEAPAAGDAAPAVPDGAVPAVPAEDAAPAADAPAAPGATPVVPP
ncbi:MAG: preprotein translocase subunit SecG [Bauldia sp.]|nr:preprotein translocase subunit SecG [Bauldia sp.]